MWDHSPPSLQNYIIMEIDNKKCKTCVHYNEQCVLDDLETCRFKKKHESF